MKKINLAVTGCMGRMGKQIIRSAKSDKNFKLVTLTEDRSVKAKINGIKIVENTEQSLGKVNLIIDFTVPKCTLQVLKIATKIKKKVVIGTTGFTKEQEKLIRKFSKKIFSKFDLCIVANNDSKKFLDLLGAKNIKNYGNLKFSKSAKTVIGCGFEIGFDFEPNF